MCDTEPPAELQILDKQKGAKLQSGKRAERRQVHRGGRDPEPPAAFCSSSVLPRGRYLPIIFCIECTVVHGVAALNVNWLRLLLLAEERVHGVELWSKRVEGLIQIRTVGRTPQKGIEFSLQRPPRLRARLRMDVGAVMDRILRPVIAMKPPRSNGAHRGSNAFDRESGRLGHALAQSKLKPPRELGPRQPLLGWSCPLFGVVLSTFCTGPACALARSCLPVGWSCLLFRWSCLLLGWSCLLLVWSYLLLG